MPYAEFKCEKCGIDLIAGRTVDICLGVYEAQMCATCQQAFDRFIEKHPENVAYFKAEAMIVYWLAQAHWRDVQQEYRQALSHSREMRNALRQTVQQWLSDKTG